MAAWYTNMLGNSLLFCLVFGMSATVDIDSMKNQIKNWRAILTGVFLQFAILPALGFLVVKVMDLEQSVGITLLVVTSSPGGSYSNWWCSMFNADLALSVAMTAISTLLSTIMLPMNLLIYTKYSFHSDVLSNIDWTSLLIALLVVISAIGLGLFVSSYVHSHKFNVFSNKLGNIAGILLVLFSALMSNTGGGDARLWNHSWQFYFGVSMPCILGLAIANVMTSLLQFERPERVTISIECCYQNVGIATSVALTMFQGKYLAEAMAVPLFYGFVEAAILGIYCIIMWKLNWTKAPSNVSFFKMIATSYEVIVAEQNEIREIEITISQSQDDVESTSVDGNTFFTYFKFNDEPTSHDKVLRAPWTKLRKQPSGMAHGNVLNVPNNPNYGVST